MAPIAGPSQKLAERMARICRLLEANTDGRLTLAELARAVGASPHHLQRTFKRLLGVSPRQYADARRLERFKSSVRQGGSVTAALYEAGYGSSSRLYERALARLGMTPAAYRRGAPQMRIAYATAASPLGRLLVARTPRGICSVNLGASDAALTAALRREFPRAQLRRDHNGLSSAVRSLVRYLDGRQPRLDLPLDIRGTAFQYRVWEELRRIPYGQTRSYGQIARVLGQPKAARAVARACATNPLPLVIPCHRVVRGTGALGGYRLGLKRKQSLLALEARANKRRQPKAKPA